MLYVLNTENLNTGSNEVGMESTYLTFNDFFKVKQKLLEKFFLHVKQSAWDNQSKSQDKIRQNKTFLRSAKQQWILKSF